MTGIENKDITTGLGGKELAIQIEAEYQQWKIENGIISSVAAAAAAAADSEKKEGGGAMDIVANGGGGDANGNVEMSEGGGESEGTVEDFCCFCGLGANIKGTPYHWFTADPEAPTADEGEADAFVICKGRICACPPFTNGDGEKVGLLPFFLCFFLSFFVHLFLSFFLSLFLSYNVFFLHPFLPPF
jgi:hypothetical protein